MLVQLLSLDRTFELVPLLDQRDIYLEAIMPEALRSSELHDVAAKHTTPSWDVTELFKIVDLVSRFECDPETLIYICNLS